MVVDTNGCTDASPGAAIGSNVIDHVRFKEIARRACRAPGDGDRITVATRLVEDELGTVFGTEREAHFIVSHQLRAHAAEVLTNLRNIVRRDEHREELLNGLETPSARRSAVTGRHVQSTGRRSGLNTISQRCLTAGVRLHGTYTWRIYGRWITTATTRSVLSNTSA